MSQKKLFWMLPVIIFGVILISGCGKDETSQEIKKLNESQKTAINEGKESLPSPTGNISDVINAVNSEAEGESNIVSKEEDDAQEAVSDKNEADNFGAIYDENEF